jgi:hypothetical protein
MDVALIKNFLGERLGTKRAVEGAAQAIGVSAATVYRYKQSPESIGLGQLVRLSAHLGLPLASGAAWSRSNIRESERRRLDLESASGEGKSQGRRLITVPAYTVNSELPEITELILKADYGTRVATVANEILAIRAERARLYESGGYESWEIWNGWGYLDFFHGRDRFRSVPADVRQKQVRHFIESSEHPQRHRFIYLRHSPDLPMFGIHSPPGVALVRIDDIHFEFQDPSLIESFEDTFNEFRGRCQTTTRSEFISWIENPLPTQG